MSYQLLLYDPPRALENLLPFTYVRPVSTLRVGILTILEKWERRLDAKAGYITRDYLQRKYPSESFDQYLVINSSLCPDDQLVQDLGKLEIGEALIKNGSLIGYRCNHSDLEKWRNDPGDQDFKTYEYVPDIVQINKVWDILQHNPNEIEKDFDLVTADRKSAPITDPYTRIYDTSRVFAESGLVVRDATINASEGPVYIGPDVVVQEGAVIKGPLAIGQGSSISMGSKIRGNVSMGPFCKVGGEVVNSVIQGYSNKGHDGFLGSSVVGEWCNLGADSNTSNLKNNYADVKLWNYRAAEYESSGRQFLGLMMGDHSKCGINTMFNTGTVVGISANIFGEGFPSRFVPSFSWGATQGFETFRLDQALEVAQKMMERRQLNLEEFDREILKAVFHETAPWRSWE